MKDLTPKQKAEQHFVKRTLQYIEWWECAVQGDDRSVSSHDSNVFKLIIDLLNNITIIYFKKEFDLQALINWLETVKHHANKVDSSSYLENEFYRKQYNVTLNTLIRALEKIKKSEEKQTNE